MSRIKRVLTHPEYIAIKILSYEPLSKLIPDRIYLKLKYFFYFKRRLNLDEPKTFNEKIQWLKLYDRKNEYTVMVDKYETRKYVANKIGENYLIPLLGVWNSPDEINFEALPNQFVLKCNHNSGLGMCICKDKTQLDFQNVRNELYKGLNQDYYITSREWPYKNVPRKIIGEQFMIDKSTSELLDYKFFCFNGEPKVILVCSNRFGEEGLYEDFFDIEWNLLSLKRPEHANSNKNLEKPINLEKMLDLAKILSKDIPFVRIDFYEINGNVYFGEITFFPQSGFSGFEPKEWDMIMGDWIKLPTL